MGGKTIKLEACMQCGAMPTQVVCGVCAEAELVRLRAVVVERDALQHQINLLIQQAAEPRLLAPVTLDAVLADSVAWGQQTFPASTDRSKAKHLLREAAELYEHPDDAGEIADILILLAQIAAVHQVDLAEAVRAKLAANRARTWGQPDADGVVEHVRAPVPDELREIGERHKPYYNTGYCVECHQNWECDARILWTALSGVQE